MTDSNLAGARRMYNALQTHDGPALMAALTPDFRGVVCAGMPQRLGGTYDGRDWMLAGCWAKVFAAVDVRPIPDEYLPAGSDRMVVVGRYVGTTRDSARVLGAAFAHILRFDGGRVSELVQITDTAAWHEALRP